MFRSNPDFRMPENDHELTRAELLEEWWRVHYNVMKYKDGKYFTDNLKYYEDEAVATFTFLQHNGSPLLLHSTMFVHCLRHLCSEEQQKKFLMPAVLCNIIGCYA